MNLPACGLVSSPGEFHPEVVAEPYVNVSAHTAPIIQPETNDFVLTMSSSPFGLIHEQD